MVTRPDEERVWLQALIASLGGLAAVDYVNHDGWEHINHCIARDAGDIADRAVKEWRARYPAVIPPPVDMSGDFT